MTTVYKKEETIDVTLLKQQQQAQLRERIRSYLHNSRCLGPVELYVLNTNGRERESLIMDMEDMTGINRYYQVKLTGRRLFLECSERIPKTLDEVVEKLSTLGSEGFEKRRAALAERIYVRRGTTLPPVTF